MQALRPCSNSSVWDGTFWKFPPREKSCLQPPTKPRSEWNDRDGSGFAPCWTSQSHLQRASHWLWLSSFLQWQSHLKLLMELGLINAHYHHARVCRIAVRAQSMLYFYLYLVSLSEGWGTLIFLLAGYLAGSLEERNGCLCSWLVKIHLCWVSFNFLEITVEMSKALCFWEAGPCYSMFLLKASPGAQGQEPVLLREIKCCLYLTQVLWVPCCQ